MITAQCKACITTGSAGCWSCSNKRSTVSTEEVLGRQQALQCCAPVNSDTSICLPRPLPPLPLNLSEALTADEAVDKLQSVRYQQCSTNAAKVWVQCVQCKYLYSSPDYAASCQALACLVQLTAMHPCMFKRLPHTYAVLVPEMAF